MSIERFFAVKAELFSDPTLLQVTTLLTEHFNSPVLTLRTITELGQALGGPKNAATYEKRFAAVVLSVPHGLKEEPAIAQLNLNKVYPAGPALEYLASLARQQHWSDAQVRSYFSPAAFFRELEP